MDQIRIGDRFYTRHFLLETNEEIGQRILADAYNKKERPMCQCNKPTVEMVIRKTATQYVLARMPNGGETHHPTCVSYGLGRSSTGKGGYTNEVIQTMPDGIIHINLKNSAQLKEAAISKPSADRLTILGLLHFLWEEAEFNKWHPGMEGKRYWGTIHKYCKPVIENIRLQDQNELRMADLLYLPQSFFLKQWLSAKSEFYGFFDEHAGKSNDTLLVTSLVQEISPTQYGMRVMLDNLGDVPLWINKEEWEGMLKRYPFEISVLHDESYKLVFIGSVQKKRSGTYVIQDAALMAINNNFIPVESVQEAMLTYKMTEERRSFIKTMQYDTGNYQAIPNFYLTDTDEPLIPVIIHGTTHNEQKELKSQHLVNEYKDNSKPYCEWNVRKNSLFIYKLPRKNFSKWVSEPI